MTKPTVEIKKLKWGAAHSHQETLNFIGEIWIDGKKVGGVSNCGQGGCTNIDWDNHETREIINSADAYFKTLPKVKSKEFNFEFTQNLEWVVDDIISKLWDEKERTKFRKSIEKKLVNHLIFVNKDFSKRVQIKYPNPISAYLPNPKNVQVLKDQMADIQKKYPDFILMNEELKGLL